MQNGLTFYICFGKYAGLQFELNNDAFRIVLGWVSFAIMRADMEVVMDETDDILQEYSRTQGRIQMADNLTKTSLIKTAEEYSEVINKGHLHEICRSRS